MATAIVAGPMVCLLVATALASAQATRYAPPSSAQKGIHITPLLSSPSSRFASVHFPSGPSPVYAREEISVHPYPVQVGEPTEVCVQLQNPGSYVEQADVQFSWAEFGIGPEFTPIGGSLLVFVPARSQVTECIAWIPPVDGQVCLQVELTPLGQAPEYSQRNVDVNEPLEPETSHILTFPVRNPIDHEVTITLGLVPHFPDWGLELSQDVLPSMGLGEIREVLLTVTPPEDLPTDEQPVVDVEAYAEAELIGGFRKIYRPPLTIHRPGEPVYAESEILVDPYPVQAGVPTKVCVELENPRADPQDAQVQFSWAGFGIGLAFTPIDGPQSVHLPADSEVTECIFWVPPVDGQVCLQVELSAAGQYPQWSQRNVDVDEPLEPDTPHLLFFPVRNPLDHEVTITLGLVPHLPDWGLELSQDVLPSMGLGEVREVILTVTPPGDLPAHGQPIVDVEAFAEGELIGGFRKIYRWPFLTHVPLAMKMKTKT
jgi:hypothetical protein